MAASKKPRKKHKPKYVARNVLTTIFGGMSGDHMTYLQSIMAKNHKAMSDIATGQGTKEGWNLIVGAVNLSLVLCDQGIGPEYREQMHLAREALISMGKRLRQTGRLLFKGDEMRDLNEAMDIHDAQLTNIRAIDVHNAAEEVQRRFRERLDCTSIDEEIQNDMRDATLARVA